MTAPSKPNCRSQTLPAVYYFEKKKVTTAKCSAFASYAYFSLQTLQFLLLGRKNIFISERRVPSYTSLHERSGKKIKPFSSLLIPDASLQSIHAIFGNV